MVMPPSPRVSNYFSRPFQDFAEPTALPIEESSDNGHSGGDDKTSSILKNSKSPRRNGAGQQQQVESEALSKFWRSQLLRAILRNDVNQVKEILLRSEDTQQIFHSGGIAPVIFSIGRQRRYDDDTSGTILSMDDVFLLKRMLGEAPTALLLAMLNVYYRCTGGGGKSIMLQSIQLPHQRKVEVGKARAIVQLLLTAPPSSSDDRSPILFATTSATTSGLLAGDSGKSSSRQLYVSPLGLATRLHRFTAKLGWKKMEEALRSVVDDMIQRDNGNNDNNSLDEKKALKPPPSNDGDDDELLHEENTEDDTCNIDATVRSVVEGMISDDDDNNSMDSSWSPRSDECRQDAEVAYDTTNHTMWEDKEDERRSCNSYEVNDAISRPALERACHLLFDGCKHSSSRGKSAAVDDEVGPITCAEGLVLFCDDVNS